MNKLDDLAKAEVLGGLATILGESKPEEKEQVKAKAEPKTDLSEKHFQAALHHSTWWAGHQGKYAKTGNFQDLSEANKHLMLAKHHLMVANKSPGYDKDEKETGDLIGNNGINPAHHYVWAGTSEFGLKLLEAAHASKKDQTKTHIGGWKIADFGPDSVLTQRKTKETELSDPGSHPLDIRVPILKSSDHEVSVESPLKLARERRAKAQEQAKIREG